MRINQRLLILNNLKQAKVNRVTQRKADIAERRIEDSKLNEIT